MWTEGRVRFGCEGCLPTVFEFWIGKSKTDDPGLSIPAGLWIWRVRVEFGVVSFCRKAMIVSNRSRIEGRMDLQATRRQLS